MKLLVVTIAKVGRPFASVADSGLSYIY